MTEVSKWATARLGDVAAELAASVPTAIQAAHGASLAAHLAGGLTSNDTYGATMLVAQHQNLVEYTRKIAGVAARRPTGFGARFDLVVVESKAVVLYPWRYGVDSIPQDREWVKFRLPVSELRRSLFTLDPRAPSDQLTLDESLIDEVVLSEQRREDAELREQLKSFGSVVTIAYSSGPGNGITDLRWGELELEDVERGIARWEYQEQIPIGVGLRSGPKLPVPKPRDARPVERVSKDTRFDDAPLSDDFGLSLRPRGQDEPDGVADGETGSTSGQDG